MINSTSVIKFRTLHVICSLLVAIVLCSTLGSCGKNKGKPKLLVFSKIMGWNHNSIPNGVAAIQKLGRENNFDVDTTTNGAYFNDDSLKKYATVVFLSTTGNVLDSYQQVAFERYIQAGGGFVGVHAATDTEYDWGWYTRLVGAQFINHPAPQEAELEVVDTTHISTRHLPHLWRRMDEWYNLKKISRDIHVLIKLNEKSYTGGINHNDHPVAWYQDYDGGRAFYTGLGHTEESYTEPAYLKHLLGGIQYAMGENNELDYGKAKSQPIPEENRFAKTQLTEGTLFEPTEMAILPDLSILVTQRRGEIMFYDNKNGKIKQAGFLNVYYKSENPAVNAEEGVLGIAADPDYKNNHFVYIFYSPADTSVNRLSRFEFKNDTLVNSSEKIILQFYSQRNICCHTGGSVAFGPDNMLFLSTGDNSTPFDEPKAKYVNHGFAPLNDLPEHIQYDARRSSGNSNDLRGKILRIRIKADGTYEIPEGNLFPRNEPKARPEIFVMGNRNPYRISVDKKTGTLYWGEVGPDAASDSLSTRGPRGYDEINRASKAGYFGWPLFVGNNFPYRNYNYATGQPGEPFDPAKPRNESKNNTGLVDLPPAQPAYIWYPYATSKDFPEVGTGGRNAMAGPVYYTENFPSETRYPDYFNGKLFIYEWMRDWIKVVTQLPDGSFDKMDPFMEHTKWNAVIDMETGPDGRIYLLEYGKGWFTKNADAGLARIDYLSGNRPPELDSFSVNEQSGILPLSVIAQINAKDPENDALTYTWTVGGKAVKTKEPLLRHTFTTPGEYQVSVEVNDGERTSKSPEITVFAGNARPDVTISLAGNKTFYFPGKPVLYDVNVFDPGGKIDSTNLFVTTTYINTGTDQASQGHQFVPDEILGKNLTTSLDCKGCHKEQDKSIGPAYALVSQKYRSDSKASDYLINKITAGGAGVWGEVAMPSHPTLKKSDVKQIVTYILSLGKPASQKTLPKKGRIVPQPPVNEREKSTFALVATYTDAGAMGVRPLMATSQVMLRSSTITAEQMKSINSFTVKDSAGTRYLAFPVKQGNFSVVDIDLAGIKRITLEVIEGRAPSGYTVEVKTGGVNGTVIGKGIQQASGNKKVVNLPIAITSASTNLTDVTFIVTAAGSTQSAPLLKAVRFE